MYVDVVFAQSSIKTVNDLHTFFTNTHLAFTLIWGCNDICWWMDYNPDSVVYADSEYKQSCKPMFRYLNSPAVMSRLLSCHLFNTSSIDMIAVTSLDDCLINYLSIWPSSFMYFKLHKCCLSRLLLLNLARLWCRNCRCFFSQIQIQ